MIAKSIKDILTELSDNSKKNEVNLEIKKVELDFWSKKIGLVIAVLGVILGALALLGVNKFPETNQIIYFSVICAGGIYFALFIFFFQMYSNRIVANLVNNHTHLKTVLEVFTSLENTYQLKFDNLDMEMKAANETSKNIANSPFSNLISWDHSGKLEIEASRVFSVCIDLAWVNNKSKLEEIFEDLKNKPNDKYRYILVSDSELANTNYTAVTDYFNEKSLNFPELNLTNRFKIIKLLDLKKNECRIFDNGNFMLPIPNDIVVYKNGEKKIAVISTNNLFKNRSNEDLNNNHDVKFVEFDQINRIELWFKRTWREITGENIDKD